MCNIFPACNGIRRIKMADFDPDNCVKLFKLDDSQTSDSTDPESVVIIPLRDQNIFSTSVDAHSRDCEVKTDSCAFPEDCVSILLKFRMELEELFNDCGDILGIAAVLWEDISCRLFDRGFPVTGKQCSAKWDALYSEYVNLTQIDDENELSKSALFAAFEDFYKLRSKYVDSKILEDVTEYLSTRSNSSPTSSNTVAPAKNNSDNEAAVKVKTKKTSLEFEEDFSVTSCEDDPNYQMLTESIDVAEKILDKNIKDSEIQRKMAKPDKRPSKAHSNVRKRKLSSEDSSWRYGDNLNHMSSEANEAKAENTDSDVGSTFISSLHEKNNCKKAKIPTRDESLCSNQATIRYPWNVDSTQCLVDLRLLIESDKQKKQSILKLYRGINKFISQKMFRHGYQVSGTDCKRKWDQLMRQYSKEAKTALKKISDNQKLDTVGEYFWQMDRVLKKSGLDKSKKRPDEAAEFFWNDESVRTLIGIRIPMEDAFAMFKRYIILWQYVASQMQKYNFSPTYSECSLKWMELCECYEICLKSISGGYVKKDKVDWDYFEDMHNGFEMNTQSTKTIINYPMMNVSVENQKSTPNEFKEKLVDNLTPSRLHDSPAKIETDSGFQELEGVEDGREIIGRNETICTENTTLSKQKREGDQDLSVICVAGKIPEHEFQLYTTVIKENLKRQEIPTEIQETEFLSPFSEHEKHFENNWRASTVPDSRTQKVLTGFAAERSKSCKECTSLVDGEERIMLWSKEATLSLLKLKLDKAMQFHCLPIDDLILWKDIAFAMQRRGYNFCYEACASHWGHLKAVYNRDRQKIGHMICSEDGEVAKPNKSENVCDHRTRIKFVWNEEMTKMLVKLRFSKEIRVLRKYGKLIADEMNAAGYQVTSAECSRKFASLCHTYKKLLRRKESGEIVKWQHFQLMDKYFNTSGGSNSETKNRDSSFLWTPDSVERLIKLKALIKDSAQQSIDDRSLPIWRKLAETMKVEGFKVTQKECAEQWNFLTKIYWKIKKGVENDSHLVVGECFKLMDRYMSKLDATNGERYFGSNEINNDIDQPVDFSIAKKKEIQDEECEHIEMINVDSEIFKDGRETCFEVGRVSPNSQPIDQSAVMNLSLTSIVSPSLNCDSSSSLDKSDSLAGKDGSGNSGIDSFHVTSNCKEREDTLDSKISKECAQLTYPECLAAKIQNPCAYESGNSLHNENSVIQGTSVNLSCLERSRKNLSYCVENMTENNSNRENAEVEILRKQEVCSKILHAKKPWNNQPKPDIVLDELCFSASFEKNFIPMENKSVGSIENNKEVQDELIKKSSDADAEILHNSFRKILPIKRSHTDQVDETDSLPTKKFIFSHSDM
ncbi:uncharacterized protein [Neodiprion pinetum]|uniref:uncharacterized protein isoform X1 n=2 Tax=Neodiprion pinetum TaxID=441929 RepID=UPI001EE0C8A5|nr:uncharacterized protein LOC124220564 isoform X1 [Neodiprion pinetum]